MCLTKCLDSVFQDLEKGDEIVLVQNGSSHNTWEVCIHYSDTHPANYGLKNIVDDIFSTVKDLAAERRK